MPCDALIDMLSATPYIHSVMPHPPADAYWLAQRAQLNVELHHDRCKCSRDGTTPAALAEPIGWAFVGKDSQRVVWATDRPECFVREMEAAGAINLGPVPRRTWRARCPRFPRWLNRRAPRAEN